MTVSRFFYTSLAVFAAVLVSCGKNNPDPEPTPEPDPAPEPQPEVVKVPEDIKQADQFAIDLLETYYLWNVEIYKDLSCLNPDTCKTPIAVVKEIRYHQNGKEVDHWTSMMSDLSSMTNSVQGLGLSYGYDLQGYYVDASRSSIVFAVNYVTKGGPAEKAGLKRGDLIWRLDGKVITLNNYMDAFESKSITLGVGQDASKLTSVSLAAEDMWENPILLDTTYVVGSKKVGYLVYNSFDIKSSQLLPDIFRKFKKNGIEELIIDLRYNGGGYVFTEGELGSLIAPEANVAAGDVFQTEVYNTILADAWKRQGYDTNTYFSNKHQSSTYNIDEDITDAHPSIKKVYAIVTGGSASASEGLIVGLGPYLDIVMVGNQTYGKYCAGWMMSPEDLYGKNSSTDYSKITKWGIYVMVSKFADKFGRNAAQPDGIPVDIEVDDNPLDGYQIGDVEETMLKAALKAAGKQYTKAPSGSRQVSLVPARNMKTPRPKGMLIKTDMPSIIVND